MSCRSRSCNQSSRSGTLHRTVLFLLGLRSAAAAAGGSCGCQRPPCFYWSNGVFCSFHEDTNITQTYTNSIKPPKTTSCLMLCKETCAWQPGMPSFQEPPAPSSLVCPGLPACYCTTTKQTHKQTHKQIHKQTHVIACSSLEMPSHASTFEAESYHLKP